MENKDMELIRKKVKRHKEEFCNAIGKIVPELQKEIKEKNMITTTIEDLAKQMGPGYGSRDSTRFYWATKLCLWDIGIYVEPKIKDHGTTLLMRYRTREDKFLEKMKPSL